MQELTVYKLNDFLTVSMTALPGFKLLGSGVIRDINGNKTGVIPMYYCGKFFHVQRSHEENNTVDKQVKQLCHEYVVSNGLGAMVKRFNRSTAVRALQIN